MEPGFISSNDAERTRWQNIVNGLQNGATPSGPLEGTMIAPASLTGPGGILETTCENDVRIYISSKGTTEDYDPDTDQDIPGGQPVYEDKVNEILGILKNNEGAPLARASLIAVRWYEYHSDLSSGVCMRCVYHSIF